MFALVETRTAPSGDTPAYFQNFVEVHPTHHRACEALGDRWTHLSFLGVSRSRTETSSRLVIPPKHFNMDTSTGGIVVRLTVTTVGGEK